MRKPLPLQLCDICQMLKNFHRHYYEEILLIGTKNVIFTGSDMMYAFIERFFSILSCSSRLSGQ